MTPQGLALMSLLTLAMLLVYFATGLMVGRARTTFNVRAPETTGPDGFNRLYRAHVNTLEQLVLSLPAFWVLALLWKSRYAAMLAAVWCVGRVIYTLAYARDADKRGLGFMISILSTIAAFIGIGIFSIQML